MDPRRRSCTDTLWWAPGRRRAMASFRKLFSEPPRGLPVVPTPPRAAVSVALQQSHQEAHDQAVQQMPHLGGILGGLLNKVMPGH